MLSMLRFTVPACAGSSSSGKRQYHWSVRVAKHGKLLCNQWCVPKMSVVGNGAADALSGIESRRVELGSTKYDAPLSPTAALPIPSPLPTTVLVRSLYLCT